MVVLLLLGLLLVIMGGAILMIHFLGKAARRKGENVAKWRLAMVMIWTFLWVIEQWVAKNDASGNTTSFPHWELIGMTILGCVLGFLVLLMILRHKPGLGEWDDKMNEIGQKP
jgi:uncharacterized membrane protein YsdA (DUF1294 family)